MDKSYDIPKIHYRRQVYYGSNGEVFMNASGESGLGYAQVFAPPSEEIRSMLLRL